MIQLLHSYLASLFSRTLHFHRRPLFAYAYERIPPAADEKPRFMTKGKELSSLALAATAGRRGYVTAPLCGLLCGEAGTSSAAPFTARPVVGDGAAQETPLDTERRIFYAQPARCQLGVVWGSKREDGGKKRSGEASHIGFPLGGEGREGGRPGIKIQRKAKWTRDVAFWLARVPLYGWLFLLLFFWVLSEFHLILAISAF